jgi:hypothetical protein
MQCLTSEIGMDVTSCDAIGRLGLHYFETTLMLRASMMTGPCVGHFICIASINEDVASAIKLS